jgi:hypothetical protein
MYFARARGAYPHGRFLVNHGPVKLALSHGSGESKGRRSGTRGKKNRAKEELAVQIAAHVGGIEDEDLRVARSLAKFLDDEKARLLQRK